jgi:hypothetical protein
MTRKSRKDTHRDAKLEIVEHIAEKAAGEVTIFSEFKRDPESSPELLDYAWDRAARHALKIKERTGTIFQGVWHDFPPGYVDTSARDLHLTFERFNLDPDDPWSWRRMAEYMSIVLSAPPRSKKVTPEWLMSLHQARESSELKNLTDSEAAYRLANDKASPFYAEGVDSKAGVEGLRKNIRKARRTFGTN